MANATHCEVRRLHRLSPKWGIVSTRSRLQPTAVHPGVLDLQRCWAVMGSLDPITLSQVAGGAHNLDVLNRIGTTLCERNNVVVMQVFCPTAFDALPSIAVPYCLFDLSRDEPTPGLIQIRAAHAAICRIKL